MLQRAAVGLSLFFVVLCPRLPAQAADTSVPPRNMFGTCYRLAADSTGHPPDAPTLGGMSWPGEFRLLDTPQHDMDPAYSWYRATPDPWRTAKSDFKGRWAFVAPDTLRVSWGNGFGGVGFRFVLTGDTARGTGQFSGDVVGVEYPVVRVKATRVRCPPAP